MPDDELIQLLHATGSYLKAHSEEAIKDLGIQFSGSIQVPARADRVKELKILLAKYRDGAITGAGLRRIAELVEFLDQPEAAFMWWERAARAGDDLSIMMLNEIPEGE